MENENSILKDNKTDDNLKTKNQKFEDINFNTNKKNDFKILFNCIDDILNILLKKNGNINEHIKVTNLNTLQSIIILIRNQLLSMKQQQVKVENNNISNKEMDIIEKELDQVNLFTEGAVPIGIKRRQSTLIYESKNRVSTFIRRKTEINSEELKDSGINKQLAKDAIDWNFSIINLENNLDTDFIKSVQYQYSFSKELNFSNEVLSNFIIEIKSKQKNNPQHNFQHGCDVFQGIHSTLSSFDLSLLLDKLEMISILTAGLSHDVGHNGFTNIFHINTSSKWATRYNDTSILENYHASFLIQTLSKENCNIFKSLKNNDWSRAKKLMILSILNTDMSKHFEIVEKIKTVGQRFINEQAMIINDDSEESSDKNNKDSKLIILNNQNKSFFNKNFLKDSNDRDILCSTVVHAVDISNPTRLNDTFLMWNQRILQEFFNQGREENKLGLPTSHGCDEENFISVPGSLSKFTMSFINQLVLPLYTELKNCLPKINLCIDNLNNNLIFLENKMYLELKMSDDKLKISKQKRRSTLKISGILFDLNDDNKNDNQDEENKTVKF